MSVEWIEHKGKRILLCDHRGMEPADVSANLRLEVEMIKEIPPPTKILFLDNFEGAKIDSAVMATAKEIGVVVEPRTEKCAIVGIHGIRHILVAAYNRVTGAAKHQRLFDTQEEALDWLVAD